VLFVLTLVVNIIARRFVMRGSHGKRGAPDVFAPEVEAGAAA
jgi:hypothetical protein